jgi:predicted RNA-binding protein YlxR (DUF448 family)
VPDDQLSLAIGREGQNARLAARLTGWRVDIRSETEFSKQESESGYDDEQGEDVGGRCHAILANGRRCPNAALPNSRYCGLDSHQALEGKPTDVVGQALRGSDPVGGQTPRGVRPRRGSDPVRQCAGCGERAPRALLHRFATVEGRLVPDPQARIAGRGAWVHPTRECFDAAVARRGFHRALRAPVTIPDETVDFIDTWPRSASTS